MENKASKCVTSLRKSHGTQHCLIVMLEKWKKALGKAKKYVSHIYGPLKGF